MFTNISKNENASSQPRYNPDRNISLIDDSRSGATSVEDSSMAAKNLKINIPVKSVASITSMNSLFDQGYTGIGSTTETPITGSYFDLDTNFSLIDRKLTKTCIMLVGLPASGKSTVARKVCQYLNHNDFKSQIYNAGDIRRTVKGTFNDSEYFSPDNFQAKEEREKIAFMAIQHLINDLESAKINVGLLDATNSTVNRRENMINYLRDSNINNVIILDIQCNDQKLLDYNISYKANNPDYEGRDYEDSIRDFKERTKHYAKAYQPVTAKEIKGYSGIVTLYVKIVNGGKIFEFIENTTSEMNYSFEINKYVKYFVSWCLGIDTEKYYASVDSLFSKSK